MKNKTEKVKAQTSTQKGTTRSDVYEWLQCLAYALIICVVVFTFFFRVVDVKGDSMNPTLLNADKRVIATEGQTIEIDFDRGKVYVDGQLLDEPYIAEATKNQLDFPGAQTVPEGCVFVMGDNRNQSSDSRRAAIGMVDERLIVGKVLFKIFPLDRIGSPYGD